MSEFFLVRSPPEKYQKQYLRVVIVVELGVDVRAAAIKFFM